MSDNIANQFAQLNLNGSPETILLQILQQQQQIQQLLATGKAPQEPRPVDLQEFSGTSVQEMPDCLVSVKNVFKLCPHTYQTNEQKKGYLGSLLIGST
jgi:hypothetical protein